MDYIISRKVGKNNRLYLSGLNCEVAAYMELRLTESLTKVTTKTDVVHANSVGNTSMEPVFAISITQVDLAALWISPQQRLALIKSSPCLHYPVLSVTPCNDIRIVVDHMEFDRAFIGTVIEFRSNLPVFNFKG